jgi:hypothetical protein
LTKNRWRFLAPPAPRGAAREQFYANTTPYGWRALTATCCAGCPSPTK